MTEHLPRTLADARRWTPDDTTKSTPMFTAAYLKGHVECLDVLGVDVEPTPEPEWLRQAFAPERSALAAARSWDKKPAPRTAAAIMAHARWSWRQVERRLAEQRQVAS